MMKPSCLFRFFALCSLTLFPLVALAVTCTELDGSYVYAADGTYLGFFGNQYASNSINNTYGNNGSSYASNSVRNTFGTYGSQYASLSATNPYSSNPPTIYKYGTAIARLSANQFVAGAISLSLIDSSCRFLSTTAQTSAPVVSVPATLTGLIASDGLFTDGVLLSWNASQGATSYTVNFSTSATGSKTFISETSNTSLSVFGGTPGVVYYYFVAPKNSAGVGIGLYDTGYIAAPANVAPANVAPVVVITGGNRTVADTNNAAGESVALTATATDSDGTIASTQWLVSGQVVATGTSATISLADGATTVTFRATDSSGATTSTTATITVTTPAPANAAPVVVITGGNRTVADTNNAAGESVALTATATDKDGTIATTQWLLAGQVVATGTSATIALADGATTITFRATDNRGATTSTTATINVGSVQVKPADYLGTYNGTAVDARYNLEVNQVALINLARMRLHACVRIFEDSKPAQVAGMHKIDVTFNISSLEKGAIQVVSTRPFYDQEFVDCSGSFETTTRIYRDYIRLGDKLFDARFKVVEGSALEFMLIGASEVLISR